MTIGRSGQQSGGERSGAGLRPARSSRRVWWRLVGSVIVIAVGVGGVATAEHARDVAELMMAKAGA